MINSLLLSGVNPQKFDYTKLANKEQRQTGSNLLSFNGRPPMNAEKLFVSGQKAIKKGEMYKGMDYFTRAVSKAEEEVTQGKMEKEKFVDMCVYVSKSFINGCLNAFNKSFEFAGKGLKMAEKDPEGQKMAKEQVANLSCTYIGSPNAIKNIEEDAVLKYKNSEVGKINQQALDLEAKKIKVELTELDKIEKANAKKQPAGFKPNLVKTPEPVTTADIPTEEAAELLQAKKIKIEMQAMKEAEEAIAKKQAIGFKQNGPKKVS